MLEILYYDVYQRLKFVSIELVNIVFDYWIKKSYSFNLIVVIVDILKYHSFELLDVFFWKVDSLKTIQF